MKSAVLLVFTLIAGASAAEAGVVGNKFVLGPDHTSGPYLDDMVNKPVLGPDGAYLGRVYAITRDTNEVQILMPSGVRVAVDAIRLVDGPVSIRAPSLSEGEMVALARLQTGHAVAFE